MVMMAISSFYEQEIGITGMRLIDRRQTLKGLSLGAGATLLGPLVERVLANESDVKSPP